MILRDIFYLQRNDRDALLAIIIAMTVLMGLIFLFNREPSETARQENDSIQTSRIEHATSQKPVYYKEGNQIKIGIYQSSKGLQLIFLQIVLGYTCVRRN